MASDGGGSLAISTAEDWRRVHQLRESYDAIGVGARTWRNDHPRLDVRREHLGREPRRLPVRVIFGGQQACPITPCHQQTYLIGSQPPEAADVIFLETSGYGLERPLQKLRERRVRSMLVEGGPTLIRSFIGQDCCDRLTVFVRTSLSPAARRLLRELLPEAPRPSSQAFGGGILLSWPDDSRPTSEPPR